MNIVTNTETEQQEIFSNKNKLEANVTVPKVHLNYLDGVRGLAALYVVLHHASRYAFDGQLHTSRLDQLLQTIFSLGGDAVVVFIVLSGFCLMLPVARSNGSLRGGAVLFFWKRAKRILPPYYLAVLFSLFLSWLVMDKEMGTPWDTCVHTTIAGLVTHLFLVQDIFRVTAHQINYPLWSVSVEWRIYFLFPLLILGWSRFGAIKTTIVTALLSAILYLCIHGTQYVESSPNYISFFVLGMLGAQISYGKDLWLSQWQQRVPWPIFSVLTSALVLVPVALGKPSLFGAGLSEVCVAVSACSLLIWASRPGYNRLRQVLSWRPLVIVGAFAYSLYLIHAPLLQLIWQCGLYPFKLKPDVTFLSLFFVGTPLIVGLSYCFSLFAERPFLNKK